MKIAPPPKNAVFYNKKTNSVSREWLLWFDKEVANTFKEVYDVVGGAVAGTVPVFGSDDDLVDSGKAAPGGEFVGDTDSQTLTNKTIDADDNTITNLEHGSEVDDPSSGVHGVVGNVVGTTDAQVLTNKTIDADDNTISNLEHGAEVDNPSSGVHGVVGDVVGTTDSQTLTNKTIDGDDNTISDVDHGTSLTGLLDDDHTQYVLADGTRDVDFSSGDFSIGDVTGGTDVTVDSNGDVIVDGLTASKPVWTDASKKLVSQDITACDVVRSRITATTQTVNTGTLSSGTVSDTQTWADGNEVHITEAASTPGFDVEYTFTSVADFCFIGIAFYYVGSSSHDCQIQIYDDTNTTWRLLISQTGTQLGHNYRYTDMPTASISDYINSSDQVKIRFYHPVNGNASHDLYIDYVSIIGTTT